MPIEIAVEHLPSRFVRPDLLDVENMTAIVHDDKVFAYKWRYAKRTSSNAVLYYANPYGGYDTIYQSEEILDTWVQDMIERGLSPLEYDRGVLHSISDVNINFARTRVTPRELLQPYVNTYVGNVNALLQQVCRDAVLASKGPCFAGCHGRFYYKLTPVGDNHGGYRVGTMDGIIANYSHFESFSYIVGTKDRSFVVGDKTTGL